MTTPRLPTPTHERVLEKILTELRADPGVRGVLLSGSAARGTARPDSDLDILVVATSAPPRRSRSYEVPVDLVVRTADEWREHLAPTRIGDESWGYAVLDGVILHDPAGVVARLVADARDRHARYRVPAHIRDHYAWLWQHVRPKMLAVLHRGDPVEIGWAVSAMTDHLVRTAWAVNDLPNPSLDLGTFQRHLDDLTVPTGVADRIRAFLRLPPTEALRAQLALIVDLEPLLA